jgi:hypothetical protein
MINLKSLSAVLLLLVNTACSQTRNVKLKLTYLAPYCGGARPTKQVLEEAEKPKPYAARTVIISKAGRIDSARTDTGGILRKKLRTGSYRLIESWRYYKRTPDGMPLTNYDSSCLKSEWTKEFGVLTLTSKSQSFSKKFDIVEQCDRKKPCLLESAREERQ